MSERHSAGDWVWLRSGAGMCGEADRLPAQIQPEEDRDWSPCIGRDCVDPDCREWVNLWTAPDPRTGRRYTLCHVSECEMVGSARADEGGGAG